MSKSSQKYYDHQREFDRINVAEMMHDIEQAEYLNTINDREEWKDIYGYKGLYQVSNLGRIKSLGNNLQRKDKILKPATNKNGYKYIILFKGGVRKNTTIHQLVAMSFLNHNPNGYKIVVNHINFNRKDNRIENLELTTQRKNTSQSHMKSSSKYTGVSWNKNLKKWAAYIKYKDVKKHLGYFINEIDASNTYQKELKKL